MDKSNRPFDNGIAIILQQRFVLQTDNVLKALAEIDCEVDEKQLPKIAEYVFDKIRDDLIDEIKRYEKKPRNKKNGYMKDITKAKEGDNKSLFRIIAWDKSWLFVDWVKDIILHAQEDRNTELLKELGEALAAEFGVYIPISAKDKQERKAMLDAIKADIAFHVTKNPTIEKSEVTAKFIKIFHNVLREKWNHWQDDESDIVLITDSFKRYLKRQRVI